MKWKDVKEIWKIEENARSKAIKLLDQKEESVQIKVKIYSGMQGFRYFTPKNSYDIGYVRVGRKFFEIIYYPSIRNIKLEPTY